MDIKILCSCGAKYQFPVEPVNGALPRAIGCPVCGLDNTALGNQAIQQQLARKNEPVPVAPAPAPMLVATLATPSATPAPAAPPPAPAPAPALASAPPPPPRAPGPPPPPPPPAPAAPAPVAVAGLRIQSSSPAHTPVAPAQPRATPVYKPVTERDRPSRRAGGSAGSRVKQIVTSITSVFLVIFGIWVVYKKIAKQVNRVGGIVETIAGEDIRWTLPDDDGAVLLVKSYNHTNVAQVIAAAHLKLLKKPLQIVVTNNPFSEDVKFFITPPQKGAVQAGTSWDWSEPQQENEAASFAAEVSKQLNTIVVMALMGDDGEAGVYAVFENGERKFRLKRWYQIVNFSANGIKEFVERDGVDWAKQHGYVPDPDKIMTSDIDRIPFEDANELTLKLGIDVSDEPEDFEKLVAQSVMLREAGGRR